MWRDYPFSQRSKTIERAVGWGMELIGKRRAGQNLEKVVGNIWGVFIK